jgi:hypothetical protein
MRRSRFSLSLFAAAALAAPLLASAGPRYAVTAVAGSMSSGSAYYGFAEDSFIAYDGAMTGLGNPDGPWSSALSIDDQGEVVGYLGVDPFPVPDELYPSGAFLYENGLLTDLNTLVDPASGWTITGAAAINDMQQIAGRACRAGVCQAVTLDLVSAVPEPPVVALLAAGLALGLARGSGLRRPVRRRRG